MLVSGSELSGQRRRQGAKMMARALGDIRFTSSSRATLWSERQLGGGHREPQDQSPDPGKVLLQPGCEKRSLLQGGEAPRRSRGPPSGPPSMGSHPGVEPPENASPGNAVGGGALAGTPPP